MVLVARFDPSDCNFPIPSVPLLPAWRGHWRGAQAQELEVEHYARARYALHAAYRLSGAGPQGTVLLPAYHCRTMLDPALSIAAPVEMYALSASLAPDMASVEAAVQRAGRPVKAVVATHFFGFTQDFQPLAAFCADRDIALIEDCAHVLIEPRGPIAPTVGRIGRYGVASPCKFVPSPDGGLLWANMPAMLPARVSHRRRALSDELRGVRQLLLRSRAARRDPGRLINAAETIASHGSRDEREQVHIPSKQYRRSDEGLTSLAVSRWVARHSAVAEIVARRRANYERWLHAVRGFPGCEALYRTLPPDCVPYMFPLHVERADRHFAPLKRMGMPIWRWDELAVSSCTVAAAYRLRLFHLPCHQSLTESQIGWMTAALHTVMSAKDAA